MDLPVIEDCTGCGACCRTQGSPPGFSLVLAGIVTDPEDEDVQLVRSLPAEALRELEDYRRRILAEDRREVDDRPCI